MFPISAQGVTGVAASIHPHTMGTPRAAHTRVVRQGPPRRTARRIVAAGALTSFVIAVVGFAGDSAANDTDEPVARLHFVRH